MNALLLIAGVAGSTSFWIVNRWADRSGARTHAYGFWFMLFNVLLSGLLICVFGQSLRGQALWIYGGIVGICFPTCLGLLMYGLKNGPSGPVVASNNMGMVWPVIIGITWLNPRQPSPMLYVGLVLVCAGLIILSLSSGNKEGLHDGQSNPSGASAGRLAATLLLLWVVAGVSMGTQAIGATRVPGVPLAHSFVINLVALFVLMPFFILRRPVQIRRCELVPGLVMGLVQVITLVCIFLAIPRIGAEKVFPFTIASPIILMLIAGHFIFHERITRPALAGCILGTVGLILLAVA